LREELHPSASYQETLQDLNLVPELLCFLEKEKEKRKKNVATPTTSQCVEEMETVLIGGCSSKSHMGEQPQI